MPVMYVGLPNPIHTFIDKQYWRAKRVIFRFKIKLTKNDRPTAYPYLAGDSFRALADHIQDDTSSFDPATVQMGDIVFVNMENIRSHLTGPHKQIKNPYILIEHNGDGAIDEAIANLLDDKIIRFYAQVVTYAHEKIVPIPIGIENMTSQGDGIPGFLGKLRRNVERKESIRKDRIFFCFNVNTNPGERIPAQSYFLTHPLMETVKGMISHTLHIKRLTSYKFVASPPGQSIESCRTWQGLYVKTVPIVKDSVTMRYFKSLGLPIWIVKDWKELDNLTEKDLSDTYGQLIRKARWEPLYMDFWIDMIRADQRRVRNSPSRNIRK